MDDIKIFGPEKVTFEKFKKRWWEFSIEDQLGNVGSDVYRAFQWQKKGNCEYFQGALDRALELMDLTIQDPRWKKRLRELCRVREMICDYFLGTNEFKSTPESLQNYFDYFALIAQGKRYEARL